LDCGANVVEFQPKSEIRDSQKASRNVNPHQPSHQHQNHVKIQRIKTTKQEGDILTRPLNSTNFIRWKNKLLGKP